jgi:hypothetical protein
MSSLNKPIESISESDLQALKKNEVSEGKAIEYKSLLPGGADAEKKEFLADVSSFANASGGHLIFGVEEKGGVPINISGLDISNPDAINGRLESIIRDGIEPRIPGIHIAAIPLKNSRKVILISIPKSWALPHMVTFQGHSKFYSRNSAGKYQLDVAELRSAFLLSETTIDRIIKFRLERLGKILSGETPIPISAGPKMALHLIPINAFDPSQKLDPKFIYDQTKELQPVYSGGRSTRFNFDGFLIYQDWSPQPSKSYLQIFRNGIFEAVITTFLEHTDTKLISPAYEEPLIESLGQYLAGMRKLQIEPPILVMLALLGVKGFTMGVPGYLRVRDPLPIESDSLIIQEEFVENFALTSADILKPIFNSIWNACGFLRSRNYDENGKWNPGG